jgi:propionate CoA-transferase
VLYVTDCCVFELRADGLHLIEVAPGIDVQRDILAQMDFTPHIAGVVASIDAAIYGTGAMGLRERLLNIDFNRRIVHDAGRDLLFLDFRHLQVRRVEDVQRIREAVEARCAAIGHRVPAVVNYDGFRLDDEVADAYVRMAHEMHERHYSRVSRYAGSAFMRLRLAKVLTRTVAPTIFGSEQEATAFVRKSGETDA